MNKQNFLRRVWNDNVEFIRHLLGDVIKILLTIGSLKLITIIVSHLFTEKPTIINYMEMASYIGILIIFIIYIVFDIYIIMKKLKEGDADEHQ
jgi:hypothetical protein